MRRLWGSRMSIQQAGRGSSLERLRPVGRGRSPIGSTRMMLIGGSRITPWVRRGKGSEVRRGLRRLIWLRTILTRERLPLVGWLTEWVRRSKSWKWLSKRNKRLESQRDSILGNLSKEKDRQKEELLAVQFHHWIQQFKFKTRRVLK